MTLILLVLFVFIFSYLMIFKPNSLRRTIEILISFVVIAACLIGLVLNDNYHWGMHEVTTTKTVSLTPLESKRAAIGIRRLGTGSERVILYRNAAMPTKTTVTSTDKTTTSIKNGATAQVQIKTMRWQYKNHWARVFFALGNHTSKLAQRHYAFTLPSTWHTVNVKAK